MFWEGNFEDLCRIFGVPCTLENLIFIWFLLGIQHISVSENLQKNTKHCEFCGTFLRDASGEDFGAILGGFLDHFGRIFGPKSEKMRSRIDLRKKVAKKSRGGVRQGPGRPGKA
jgi:hypothetical protein